MTKSSQRDQRRSEHGVLLLVVIDDRAQKDARDGGHHEEAAGQDGRGDDRLGAQVSPEREGEPDEVVGGHYQQGNAKQPIKGLHASPISGYGRRT